MVTLQISGSVVFLCGVATGLIVGAIGLLVIAWSISKKKK
jgi:hypothetical protein